MNTTDIQRAEYPVHIYRISRSRSVSLPLPPFQCTICMLLIYAFLLIREGSQIAGITIESEKQERKIERTSERKNARTHRHIRSVQMRITTRPIYTMAFIYMCVCDFNLLDLHIQSKTRRFRSFQFQLGKIHGYSSCLF